MATSESGKFICDTIIPLWQTDDNTQVKSIKYVNQWRPLHRF